MHGNVIGYSAASLSITNPAGDRCRHVHTASSRYMLCFNPFNLNATSGPRLNVGRMHEVVTWPPSEPPARATPPGHVVPNARGNSERPSSKVLPIALEKFGGDAHNRPNVGDGSNACQIAHS